MRAQLAERVAAAALAVARRAGGREHIALDYPTSAANEPRWGHGKPLHRRLQAIVERDEERQREALATIAAYAEDLRRIAAVSPDPAQPSWVNDWIPGLDGAAIYAFMRSRAPRLYLETGSGNTTRFAARARADGALDSRIVSIDPHPRVGIDGLCDEMIRAPLESVELALFERLRAGDIAILDGSHRVFMNSDVVAFMLEVLPELAPGVLVGIHDVGLPSDYGPATAERYYSEQYLLAAYLLGGADVSIVLPAHHAHATGAAGRALDELWSTPGLERVERHGAFFWLETR